MALVGRDDARAAALLEALATDHPGDDFAADALLAAAELAEEKLGRPDHAAALYERLLERHPSSRLSLRARARSQFLRQNLGAGAAPLAEYQAILLGYAGRPPAESHARMERLLAAHPAFPLADRGRLWLARGELSAGRAADAMRRFEALERRTGSATADAALWREARLGHADAALAAGHPLRARALYRTLVDGDRAADLAARAGLAETTRALVRWSVFAASLAWLALYLGVCAWQARGGLLRLPVELTFYAPVALLFVAAAATENRAIAVATSAIALGGGALIWLHGAATVRRLTRGPLSLAARIARAAATLVTVAALAFAAIHGAGLTDLVVETLKNGPARY